MKKNYSFVANDCIVSFVEIFFGLGANLHVTHGHPFVTIPPPTHTEWSAHKLDFFCQTIAKEADIIPPLK